MRTTARPGLLGEAELLELAEELAQAGVRRWVLQPFRADGARPGALTTAPSPLTPQLLVRLRVRQPEVDLRA